jgi:uncharacterized membrane protein (DUF2068 family)
VSAATPPAEPLRRRDALWVLRRCGRRGHEIAWLDDPLSRVTQRTDSEPALLRCLRCGAFVTAGDPADGRTYGTREQPVSLGAVSLAVRGSHGRKLALLRIVAVERALRALLLLALASGIFAVGAYRGTVVAKVNEIIVSAYPLAQQVGWDISHSHMIATVQELLGASAGTYTLLGAGFVAYALLQFVEAFGLWGGWRWAEYLAVIATSVFIPLEVYEIAHTPSPLKVLLLVVNVAIIGYLIYKGRLFGVRGGHEAYLSEIRVNTLLGNELAAAGRDPLEQSSTVLV